MSKRGPATCSRCGRAVRVARVKKVGPRFGQWRYTHVNESDATRCYALRSSQRKLDFTAA